MKNLEICAYKEIKYHPQCELCDGLNGEHICYTNREDLEHLLKTFDESYLLIHPNVKRFYLKWGFEYKDKLRSLK